jgi:hypothetical protein
MALKATAGGVSHDRCGSRHFSAKAIQHPPLHTGHRGRSPRQSGGVQRDALLEIGVKVHGSDCAQS